MPRKYPPEHYINQKIAMGCKVSKEAHKWLNCVNWDVRMSASKAAGAAIEFARAHEEDYIRFCMEFLQEGK